MPPGIPEVCTYFSALHRAEETNARNKDKINLKTFIFGYFRASYEYL